MQNTRNEILDYCFKETLDVDLRNLDALSTDVISEKLSISRSLTSQYLNALFKEGKLIKITSRPVYYLYKYSFEKQYNLVIKNNIIDDLDELHRLLSSSNKEKLNFQRMIGYDGSLANIIEQQIAALRYPQGLHTIICGNHGTGKSLFVSCTFDYALDNNIFSERATLYKKNAVVGVSLIDDLIGAKTKAGLFEKCQEGIIYIKHAQNISSIEQQKLAIILDKNTFYNEHTKKLCKLQAYIIFSYDETKINSSAELVKCFPIKLCMPSYNNLYVGERNALIISLYKRQALIFNKKIFVSNNVLKRLSNGKFLRNIDELKNNIIESCANANSLSKDKKIIYINLDDLNKQIVYDQESEVVLWEETSFVDVMNYTFDNTSSKLIDLFANIFYGFSNNSVDKAAKLANISIINFYSITITDNDQLELQNSYEIQNKIDKIRSLINPLNVSISKSTIHIILIYDYLKKSMNPLVNKWYVNSRNQLTKIYNNIINYYPVGGIIVDKIKYLLAANLDYTVDDLDKLLFLLDIYYSNSPIKKSNYLCIIASHGFATATSIAQTVNYLLGTYLFEAIDMPLSVNTMEVAKKIKKYIDKFSIKKDVILLVDMGSLKELSKYLLDLNINIGIINNVSTTLALAVGEKVLSSEYEMQDILKLSLEQLAGSYKIIKNNVKRDLIIFTSDNGLSMAEKMKNIFLNSLPKSIDVETMTVDGNNFRDATFLKKLNCKYNILMIYGLTNLSIKIKNYISLEEILSSKNIDKLSMYLSGYMNKKEMKLFINNLLHNFSLENVIDSLSILDAKKLLYYVEDAVNKLQEELEIKLSNKAFIGLCMHTCCMVERLVTKEPIKTAINIDTFKKENQRFIKILNKAFRNICSNYGVEIAICEISYLYDYIKNDSLAKEKE